MNYDIRKLCNYFPEIHSRYYIDTNGCVYTSLAPNTKKFFQNGKRYSVSSFVRNNITKLNKTDKQIIAIPDCKNYYLLYDGTILQRLKTSLNEPNVVVVNLVCIEGRKQFKISRLVAGTFIGDIANREVHHVDENRLNNCVENLSILTFDEHRGYGNFKKNHNL